MADHNMSDHNSHCPFLNRADARCANHFSLDKLDRAFEHCFGEYHACGTYQEMLVERRSRRGDGEPQMVVSESGLTGAVYANLTIRRRPAHVTVNPLRVAQPEHATAA